MPLGLIAAHDTLVEMAFHARPEEVEAGRRNAEAARKKAELEKTLADDLRAKAEAAFHAARAEQAKAQKDRTEIWSAYASRSAREFEAVDHRDAARAFAEQDRLIGTMGRLLDTLREELLPRYTLDSLKAELVRAEAAAETLSWTALASACGRERAAKALRAIEPVMFPANGPTWDLFLEQSNAWLYVANVHDAIRQETRNQQIAAEDRAAEERRKTK